MENSTSTTEHVSVCAVGVANRGIQQYKQLPKKPGGRGTSGLLRQTAKLALPTGSLSARQTGGLSANHGQMGATHCDRNHELMGLCSDQPTK